MLCHVLLIFSTFKTEHSSRPERKRRDSFGMFDGYDSCSEDTSSSSSSEESEEEVAPLPSNLPIIKNNGQVYTYPDGKSGMGEYAAFHCYAASYWRTCSDFISSFISLPWNFSREKETQSETYSCR